MIVGIDSISFFTSRYYLPMQELACARKADPDRFTVKIDQEKMAVSPPGEDIVTLGANAASQALSTQTDAQRQQIDLLILATESSVDQSKAAAIYVHRLLDLNPECRVFETKQACYGATGSIALATSHIKANPDSRALIIAADIARYGLGTPGETTQGAGAAAMVISADPRILALDAEAGFHTEDVMDFWRPNYRSEAIVDGKSSIRIYIKCLLKAWERYQTKVAKAELKRPFDSFAHFCYHLPFTAMADMAHKQLIKTIGTRRDAQACKEMIADSQHYNRIVGNTYAASLYVALCSLLDHADAALEHQRIGLFSYGSGCMGEFFSGTVQPGFKSALLTAPHQAMLDSRQALSYAEYADFFNYEMPDDGTTCETPPCETGAYRLSGLRNHKRQYTQI